MVPKSSNGDRIPGSLREHQPTEPMQNSNDVITSYVLGKHKDPGESQGDRESVDVDEVKDDEEDDDDDEEEDEDEEEEEDGDSNWDKDSFDGVEYNSSDYDRDYNDKEFEKMSRFYYRTGFFERTDCFPPYRFGGIGRVKDLDGKFEDGMTVRQFLINLATECVEKYNKTKNKNVRFHHLLRANFHPGSFTKYYITFVARESDSPDAPLVHYQAKAGEYCGDKTYPILCRPSPP